MNFTLVAVQQFNLPGNVFGGIKNCVSQADVVTCFAIETPRRLWSLLVVGQGRKIVVSVPTISCVMKS